MAGEVILLDTSILIEFFRKKKKENTSFYKLTEHYQVFAVSVITEYEIYSGSSEAQELFWRNVFKEISVLSFDSTTNEKAVSIYKDLKSKNKLIEIPDILIAATALHYDIPLATINRKHFERIEGLRLLE